MEKRVVFEGRNLTTGYKHDKQRVEVHQGLNFTLYAGEMTCLLGCNGAGKSTLLRTLATAQPALSGKLNLFGKDIADYSNRELSKSIGIVLTERTQIGGLTVYELVALGRQPHTGYFGRLRTTDKELVHRAIELVGLREKSDSYMAQLSDGERQKAMIAKALVQECPIIILDEPTAFLDVVSRIEMMELLHQIAVNENKAVLLSTHDVEQALSLSDKLWVMTNEKKMRCGTVEDVVLSGCMDHLFEHQTIRFDLNKGGYLSHHKKGKDVVLMATDSILYYWAQNALQRNGFRCCSNDGGYSLPCLEVQSSHVLIWKEENKTVTYHSFEELLSNIGSCV